MTDKLPVYGFLGHAPSTWENIHANLASDLPDEALFIVPTQEHLEFGAPSLIPVVKWLRENYDAGDTQESFSVLMTLKKYLGEGHQVTLIMLWDENDEVDQTTLQVAHDEGIPVLDLPRGMLALPKARPASLLREVEFDTTDDSPPWEVERQAHEFYQDPEHLSIAASIGKGAITITDTGDGGAVKAFSDAEVLTALRSFIQQIIHRELKDMGLTPGVNKVPQVSPISDTDEDQRIMDAFTQPVVGSPVPPMPADVQPTTKWVRSADGMMVRRRPGRLAKGLEVVELTEGQVKELKAAGKIRD